MSETFTAYGIGPDKYGDELQTIRIGNGALNVNWIKQCAEAALRQRAGGSPPTRRRHEL